MKNVIVWWVTCLIWGSVWLFIKMGVTDLPPISFAGLRLLIALAVLVPVLMIRRAVLPRRPRDWGLIAATGWLLLGLNYACTFWGTQYVSSGFVAIMQASQPAFGMGFAHFLLKDERFSLRKLAAIALGVGGVVVLVADRLQVAGAAGLWGSLAVVAGGVCVALGYVLIKAYGRHLEPTTIMTGQMVCAVVPLMAFGLVHDGNPMTFHWTSRAIASLLYLALAGSVAAFWLNYWLLRRMGATTVLAMALVEPLIAVALGAVVLHEQVTVLVAFGGVAILASVWLLLAAV